MGGFFFPLSKKGRGSGRGAEAHCPEVWGVRVIHTEEQGKRRWRAACICENRLQSGQACKPGQGPRQTQAWRAAVWVLRGGRAGNCKMPGQPPTPCLPRPSLQVTAGGEAGCGACPQPGAHLKCPPSVCSLTRRSWRQGLWLPPPPTDRKRAP